MEATQREWPELVLEMLSLTCCVSWYIVYSGKSIDNCLNALYFVLLSTVYVFGSVLCGASVAALFLA